MKRNVHFKGAFPAVAVGLSVAAVMVLVGCDSTERSTANPTADHETTAVARDQPSIPAGSLSEDMLGQTVTVAGEVVEQCPASGCWLKMKSGGGETFVDLLPSPVRLSEDRVGQPARVTGEVVKRGSEFAMEAKQVEFGPAAQDAAEDKN